jgi:hypothetical protein
VPKTSFRRDLVTESLIVSGDGLIRRGIRTPVGMLDPLIFFLATGSNFGAYSQGAA